MPVRPKSKSKINPGIARLLDANLNRVREGIRVVEDTARFHFSDESLYRRFRQIRHQLHQQTQIHYSSLIQSRSSSTDPGRKIKEGSRDGIGSVVASNLRRAQEGLRVLEEYGKVFTKGSSENFKKIRFQLYSLEKKIMEKI